MCDLQDAMIMGSDYYETLEECEYVPGCLPMGVGDGSIVRRAIIDKNARVGERCQVSERGRVGTGPLTSVHSGTWGVHVSSSSSSQLCICTLISSGLQPFTPSSCRFDLMSS
jgi:hypothetical protein